MSRTQQPHWPLFNISKKEIDVEMNLVISSFNVSYNWKSFILVLSCSCDTILAHLFSNFVIAQALNLKENCQKKSTRVIAIFHILFLFLIFFFN